MLPSKGYFSEIPCVFYLGEGCSRRCCHYRHSLQDVKNDRGDVKLGKNKVSAKSNSWTEDQINLVTKLVGKAVEKVFSEEPGEHLRVGKNKMVRETLNKLLMDNQALEWVTSNKKVSRDVKVPAYRPTPIAKLNDRHIPVVCVPEKPLSMTSQLKRLKTSTPASANSMTSYEIDTKILHNYPDYSRTPLSDRVGLFRCGRVSNDDQSKKGDGMDCDFLYSSDDSSHSQTVEFEIQSESDPQLPAAPSTVFSSLEDESIQSDVHRPIIYDWSQTEMEHNYSYNYEKGMLNSSTLCLGVYQDVNSIQTNKDTSNDAVTPTSSKHGTLKPESKVKNVGGKSLKKCLSLKCHKTKPNLHSKSKSVKNGEESANLKRSSSDRKRDVVPTKKLKGFFSKEIPENSGHSAGKTNEETFSGESRVDVEKGVNSYHKPTTTNSLQVASTADPFTRWMKNKKVREILGKNKTKPKQTNDINSKNVEKFDTQKICISNEVSQYETENVDSEPLPVPKFTQRLAHKKDEVRPYPTMVDSIKIPLACRQHFCDAFFQEFKKAMSVEEAKSQAVKKELDVAKNSGLKSYKNNGSLQLMKLRKNGYRGDEDPEVFEEAKLEPSSCPDFTHGWSLYTCFSKYLMTEEEMRDNGYPLPIPGKPYCAFVEKSARRYSKEQPDKPSVRICANCSEEFEIGKDGVPLTEEDCFYHWGRLRKVRSMGQWLEKFTCCDGFGDSVPCESSTYHVRSERNEDCMDDFVETTKLPSYMEECDSGIYALDCEMCYTTKGLELARLTVVDLNEEVIFDQVVSLDNPVLNYCTRFSGIDETKMRQATYKFEDVRAWVLDRFFDKTILIGHSLENDLKALKLIHKTVIDTSVTFPHKFGPPNRMSLKHLASSLLRINIQDDEGGHDSKEDATTCLKLMMMKIKEDSKARKPRIIIGYNGKKR